MLGAANSGRVVSDKPTPIFTMDGSKRTMMLTPQTTGQKGFHCSCFHSSVRLFVTAEGILIEILSRWKMESHVNDCVLVSVVKDKMFVVRDTSPLIVKSKWPLIVSSNKNEIPKCRFLVRCVEGDCLVRKILSFLSLFPTQKGPRPSCENCSEILCRELPRSSMCEE